MEGWRGGWVGKVNGREVKGKASREKTMEDKLKEQIKAREITGGKTQKEGAFSAFLGLVHRCLFFFFC
jgi:hypothetical protein